jgi:hypothetical protein
MSDEKRLHDCKKDSEISLLRLRNRRIIETWRALPFDWHLINKEKMLKGVERMFFLRKV